MGTENGRGSGYDPDFDCDVITGALNASDKIRVLNCSWFNKKQFTHYLVLKYDGFYAMSFDIESTIFQEDSRTLLKSNTFKEAMKEAQYVWSRHREEILNK